MSTTFLLFHNDNLMHISQLEIDKIEGKNSTFAFRMTNDKSKAIYEHQTPSRLLLLDTKLGEKQLTLHALNMIKDSKSSLSYLLRTL